jgi:hypothetical protein
VDNGEAARLKANGVRWPWRGAKLAVERPFQALRKLCVANWPARECSTRTKQFAKRYQHWPLADQKNERYTVSEFGETEKLNGPTE